MLNPFDPGYYESDALRAMGFKAVGENVRIAKSCTILGLPNIELGSDVRIDGYTIISASADGAFLKIGSNVHLGGWNLLIAGAGIEIGDFCSLSHGVRVFTRSDDYSGEFMTNPTLPPEYTNVTGAPVRLEKHCIVGSGSILLPGVMLGEGVAIGSMTMIKDSLAPWGLYVGIPARRIRDRSRHLLKLGAQLREVRGV